MKGSEFYGSNNKEKYPEDGKLNLCKKCVSAHVDSWDSSTYTWILQELDVPYVPDEWNKLLLKYGQDKSKMTGTTVLGRYLSKMKLKQYKDYRWADTEYLQEINNNKIKETMTRQGYTASQIDEVIEKGTYTSLPMPPPQNVEEPDPPQSGYVDYSYSSEIEQEMIKDLTDEDRRYLCIKWGKAYRPDEWIRLEQLFQEMMESYDIQSAGDRNTLILACKSSLKANQLMDVGDIDGAQKAGKMYDNFMKSGKWTAAQNKTEDSEFIDAIGELVAICEADGFIPKYYVDGPQDAADRVIEDLKKYTSDLITNETGLSTIIETAVKQIQEENEKIKAAAETGTFESSEEEKMFDYDENVIISDKDFSDFKDFQNELTEQDARLFEGDD